jgi:ketosteroid isomerase-like protein
MNTSDEEVREIVHRETKAWDEQDINKLMSLFHPDMVWPWPGTEDSHDPWIGF